MDSPSLLSFWGHNKQSLDLNSSGTGEEKRISYFINIFDFQGTKITADASA